MDGTTLADRAVEALINWIRLWRSLEKGAETRKVLHALYREPENNDLKQKVQARLEKELRKDRALERKLADVVQTRTGLDITRLTVFAVPILFIVLTAIVYLPQKGPFIKMCYFCNNLLTLVETGLSVMFVVSLVWAVILYSRVRNKSVGLSFHGLADIHKLWSQVWFNISVAIFLGGMIYAIFHVGESICGDKYWTSTVECTDNSQCAKALLQSRPVSGAFDGSAVGDGTGQQGGADKGDHSALSGSTSESGETSIETLREGAERGNKQRAEDPWVGAIKTILPNVFIFSLFFVIWQWSAKHYRVHWHNYVSNAFRHRALLKIADLEEGGNVFDSPEKRDETVSDLRIMAAMLLLLPMKSAYTEKGEEAGETGAERIIKVEEMLREIITRRSR